MFISVCQDEYKIRYKDQIVGLQRLDLFVSDEVEVVVELKVGAGITLLHLAQLISYMKTVSKPIGLLFRFDGPKPDFQRRILTPNRKPGDNDVTDSTNWIPNNLFHLELTHGLLRDYMKFIKS